VRILLFTGKGGVGKTAVSAASALRCAGLGKKTLVISTDSAHSLSDCFEQPLSNEVRRIAPRLYGKEINVYDEIKHNWGTIQNYLSIFLRSQGIDSAVSEELAVFPGMEELFSLMDLREYSAAESYDVVIVDCAPTAGTLRLLSFPDVIQWYMERFFPIERKLVKTVKPLAQRLWSVPLPDDEVYASFEDLYRRIEGIKEILTDTSLCSVRLIINPEKMVIQEARRAFTYLHLFGFGVDLVIVNRVIPDDVTDSYFSGWKKTQKERLREIGESFSPLPILTSRFFPHEVVGRTHLLRMADEIYGDRSPADVFCREEPVKISGSDGHYRLSLALPFTDKGDLDVWLRGEELVIKVRDQRRNLFLPRALAGLRLLGATFADGQLTVEFGGDEDAG